MIVKKDCGCYVRTTDNAEGVMSLHFCSEEHSAKCDELQPLLTKRGFTFFWVVDFLYTTSQIREFG